MNYNENNGIPVINQNPIPNVQTNNIQNTNTGQIPTQSNTIGQPINNTIPSQQSIASAPQQANLNTTQVQQQVGNTITTAQPVVNSAQQATLNVAQTGQVTQMPNIGVASVTPQQNTISTVSPMSNIQATNNTFSSTQQNLVTPTISQESNNVPNTQPTTIRPQVANVVTPIMQQETQNIALNNDVNTNNSVQSSVIEEVNSSIPEIDEDKSDVADITFDYNQIYGIQNTEEEKNQELDVVDKPMFTAQEINIETNSLQDRTASDVVPEFNINALDSSVNQNDVKLTDNVLSDKQQDKQETKRAIIWIAVLVLILIIFVGFIFPIIAGYNF